MTLSPHISAPAAARILIVDDNPDSREVLGIILGFDGFESIAAGSAEEALVMLTQERVDLILIDFLLPAMSGLEAAATIKRDPATRHIPIVVMTAMNDAATRQRALQSGADDFLGKPFERAELSERVRKLLLAPVAT